MNALQTESGAYHNSEATMNAPRFAVYKNLSIFDTIPDIPQWKTHIFRSYDSPPCSSLLVTD